MLIKRVENWSGRWDLNPLRRLLSPETDFANSHRGGQPPRALPTKGDISPSKPLVVGSNTSVVQQSTGYFQRNCNGLKNWSGRWDLNPRQLAWEARTLPLSYARSLEVVTFYARAET